MHYLVTAAYAALLMVRNVQKALSTVMNTIERLRRYAPSQLLSAVALSVALAAGCGAEPAAGSSAQYDTEDPTPAAACSGSEMDPLVACAAEPCAGMSGDPLSECMDVSCPETVFDVSQGCAECIIVNLSSMDDVANYCGTPAQPTAAACTAAEMDPLVACSVEPCAGMSGDLLTECMDESCPETVWDVSEGCASCIIGSLASVEAFAQACGG